METPSRALVFFVAGRERSGKGFARLCRRSLVSAHAALYTRLSMLFGGPICHVAIAVDDVVLDPMILGDHLWPTGEYIARYPGLAAFCTVPLVRTVDLRARPRAGRRTGLGALAAVLTRGRYPAHDCVHAVRTVLAEGGIDTPRNIVTPANLMVNLVLRGCNVQGFETQRLSK